MRSRVLWLTWGLNPGGTERLLLSSVPYLDHGRFRYEIAFFRSDTGLMASAFTQAGIPVHVLGDRRGLGSFGRLRRLVRTLPVHLVHAHAPLSGSIARVVVPRIPMVYTEHSVWSGYRPFTRWANALTFAGNDRAFAVADAVGASMRVPGLSGMARRVDTLYHGPDPRRYVADSDVNQVRAELGIEPEVPLLGSVANFAPQKAHGVMLEALARLRRTVPDVCLMLVGGGTPEEEAGIRRRIGALGLEDAVVLTGRREDAVRLSAAFDVFVLSSHQEGLSIALLEAMGNGIPAVVTAVGGLPEVVRDGVEGSLVPPRRPDLLATAIERLLRDPAGRARMGEAARVRADAFDIRTAVARTEAAYRELLCLP